MRVVVTTVALAAFLLAAPAWAEGHGAAAKPAESTTPAPAPVDEEVPPARRYTETEIKLLEELDGRRIDIDRREQVLVIREKLLDLAEDRVSAQVGRLEELQAAIKKLLGNLSDKEEQELDQLARIYENMKPASAAEVLNGLDNRIVYDLFRRMKQKNTAKIIEKMDTAKARTISEMLAEKTALPALP